MTFKVTFAPRKDLKSTVISNRAKKIKERKNKMKNYQKPQLDIFKLNSEEVICTSPLNQNDDFVVDYDTIL